MFSHKTENNKVQGGNCWIMWHAFSYDYNKSELRAELEDCVLSPAADY